MGLKDEKKKAVIIDDLNLFAEKLLVSIADESEEGRAKLVKTIEDAQERYNEPLEDWLTGWFYKYYRIRGSDINLAVQCIKAFPNAYTRLQEFKLLVAKGEWNKGSFNYDLFEGLINSIPDYEPLKKNEVEFVIRRLRELIRDKIDDFMFQYDANTKLIESREKERQSTQQSVQKSVDDVLVANNLETAKSSAVTNPDKIQFSIFIQNAIWKLYWVDLMGKTYNLEPSEELVKLLIDQKVQNVDSLNPVHKKRLKKECVKAREMFLDRLEVLVNPKDPITHVEMNNDALLSAGILSSFILLGKAKEYTLYWINSLGNVTKISLEMYPNLSAWLGAQNSLTEEHIINQLKTYLLHVNTSKSIGMDEFKNQLKRYLCWETTLPKSDLNLPVPKKLDLSLFAEIARCLANSPKRSMPLSDSKPEQLETPVIEANPQSGTPGKLNLKLFGAVTQALGHQPRAETEDSDEAPVFR